MPCDHYSLQVPASKYEELVNFLVASLGHMGFKEHYRPIPAVVGLGEERPYFWISSIIPAGTDEATILTLLKANHMAFTAKNAEQVRQFHEAALKAGGTCNGPPGLRPQYHPNYYGAFVRDPAVGLNFEVVCHQGGDGKLEQDAHVLVDDTQVGRRFNISKNYHPYRI